MMELITHQYHVACLVYSMGQELKLNKSDLNLLFECGIYHDIGKEKISGTILNKPSKLTEIEYDVIKFHSNLGAEMLTNDGVNNKIIEAVMHHHERYDGTGYPSQLKGKDIPLFSRILAIADTFDAITSERPYSKKYTNKEAVEEIKKNAGTQFDPELVERFEHILLKNDVGSISKDMIR